MNFTRTNEHDKCENSLEKKITYFMISKMVKKNFDDEMMRKSTQNHISLILTAHLEPLDLSINDLLPKLCCKYDYNYSGAFLNQANRNGYSHNISVI